MNFNVNRRNNSLISHSKLRERKEHKSFKKIINSTGENLLNQAKQIYYSQQNLNQALRLFEQYLSIHPRQNEPLYLAAVCYLHLGKSQEAIQKLINVSDEYQNKPNAMLLVAMAFNKLGNIGKSLEAVNQCIKKYQQFEEAICFRGKLYMNMNFFHKAEQDFKTVINYPKPSFLSFSGLADCYRSLGRIEKALHYYEKALQTLSSNNREQTHYYQIQLKMSICLYQQQKFQQSYTILKEISKHNAVKSSQLFYYLGQCQIKLNSRQVGLLNLEYSLRLQTNPKITKRAYKKLIQIYLENNQFYEALNIVKLGEICRVNLQIWKSTVEAFMLIIKGQYQQGVSQLSNIIVQVKGAEESKKIFKIKRDSSEDKSKRQNRYHLQNTDFKKNLFASPNRSKEHFSKDKVNKKLGYFSTKSVMRAVPKIQSTRINSNPFYIKKEDTKIFKTQHSPQDKQQRQKLIFNTKQKEFMYPLILQFQAYGQFFLNNFMKCFDIYEEYQSFIKDVFGKESDISYNKLLCQALLMAQSDMQDEALVKYSNCVDVYYEKYGIIPSEPLLYKVILLVKLAIVKTGEQNNLDEQDASFHEILESTLQMIENYKPAIGNHHLTHYYKSLIYILLDKIEESRETLEKTLKITQECSWKFLYVKGVVEMMLGNYYDAVKQFSAGLILESRAQFYLGRSISFLMLSQKQEKNYSENSIKTLMKSVHISSQLAGKREVLKIQNNNKTDLLVENCFEDLQKYIELQNNQEQISLWVSKILFVNRAYDEAIRSLTKINNQTEEVLSMIECIEIYEGEFQNGGVVGQVLKSAFDAHFLDEKQQGILLNEKLIKNYNNSQYGYLTSQYQKWLIVLHLYAKGNYQVLTKYLQKQMFSNDDDITQILLRYNLAMIYYLTGQFTKGLNVFKGLYKYQEKYGIKKHLDKIVTAQFDNDQCLDQLKQEIGINCTKLLSSYLPFKPIHIINCRNERVRIYIKLNIPFPKFNNPSLKLEISNQFILEQLKPTVIQKKIQAPWIRKIRNKNIQFTQKLQESVAELDDIGNSQSLKNSVQIQSLQ